MVNQPKWQLKPIDSKIFEQNLYVGLIGFYLPQENFIEITKEFFKKNNEISLKRISDGNLTIDPLSVDMMQTVLKIHDHSMTTTEDILTYNNGLLKLEDYIPKNQSILKVNIFSYSGEKFPKAEEYFPCIQYLNNACLATTKERQKYIEQTIQNNQVFLDRFQWLVNNSTHNTVIIPTGAHISATLPTYQGINTAYFLALSEATLKIINGKIDKGLEQLFLVRKWINLHYQPESNPTLLDLVVSTVHKQYLDQTIDALLNSGLLNNQLNNLKLEFITQPYLEDSSLAMQKAALLEFKNEFFSAYAPYVKIFTKSPNNINLSQEDQYILLDYIQSQGMTLSPTLEILFTSLELTKQLGLWSKAKELDELKHAIKKASSNRFTGQIENLRSDFGYETEKKYDKNVLSDLKKEFNDSIQSLDDWYSNYYANLGISIKDALSYLNTQHPSTEFFNAHFNILNQLEEMNNNGQLFNYTMIEKMLNEDFLHTITLQFAFPQNDGYTRRFNEQQNYHQLVYLKYLILRDKIPTDKISAFLESQGDLAKNTITKEPYRFDAKTRMLSTPLPKERKHLPHSIRTAKDNNPSIQNFEVLIPQI